MSGALSVPNQFQNAVTATGLQLDTNFSTVTAYINDPTNRNNYAADGAATNTVALTFSPAVAGGYTAGLELTWKWGVTNTGGVQVNANGLGNISLVNPDGSALQAGQGKAGSIGKAVYDGTRAIYISASAQKPAEAKAWAVWQGTATGTITPLTSYNVTSVVRSGAGTYSVNITTPFASTTWVALCDSDQFSTVVDQKAVNSVRVRAFNSSIIAADAENLHFVAFGVQ